MIPAQVITPKCTLEAGIGSGEMDEEIGKGGVAGQGQSNAAGADGLAQGISETDGDVDGRLSIHAGKKRAFFVNEVAGKKMMTKSSSFHPGIFKQFSHSFAILNAGLLFFHSTGDLIMTVLVLIVIGVLLLWTFLQDASAPQ